MTQYNTLNLKLSNWQIKLINGSEVTLKLSSNVVGGSNDENNFLHKSLLTITEVSKLPKPFANNSSANVKLSEMSVA